MFMKEEERHYFTEPVKRSNDYKKATKKEIKEAEALKKRLEDLWAEKKLIEHDIHELKATCPHTVMWDEPTYIYTYRNCLACGKCVEEI